jgi:hypothetical protein
MPPLSWATRATLECLPLKHEFFQSFLLGTIGWPLKWNVSIAAAMVVGAAICESR